MAEAGREGEIEVPFILCQRTEEPWTIRATESWALDLSCIWLTGPEQRHPQSWLFLPGSWAPCPALPRCLDPWEGLVQTLGAQFLPGRSKHHQRCPSTLKLHVSSQMRVLMGSCSCDSILLVSEKASCPGSLPCGSNVTARKPQRHRRTPGALEPQTRVHLGLLGPGTS